MFVRLLRILLFGSLTRPRIWISVGWVNPLFVFPFLRSHKHLGLQIIRTVRLVRQIFPFRLVIRLVTLPFTCEGRRRQHFCHFLLNEPCNLFVQIYLVSGQCHPSCISGASCWRGQPLPPGRHLVLRSEGSWIGLTLLHSHITGK